MFSSIFFHCPFINCRRLSLSSPFCYGPFSGLSLPFIALSSPFAAVCSLSPPVTFLSSPFASFHCPITAFGRRPLSYHCLITAFHCPIAVLSPHFAAFHFPITVRSLPFTAFNFHRCFTGHPLPFTSLLSLSPSLHCSFHRREGCGRTLLELRRERQHQLQSVRTYS